MLLGDPFHFLTDWPPFAFIRRHCPSFSPLSSLMRGDSLRRFIRAESAVLFYQCLPNKTFTVYPRRRINQDSPINSPNQVIISQSWIIQQVISRMICAWLNAEKNVQLPRQIPARRGHSTKRLSKGARGSQSADATGKQHTNLNWSRTITQGSVAFTKRTFETLPIASK